MSPKGWLFSLAAIVAINFITFLAPVELYDGVAVSVSGEEFNEKLSLSYLLDEKSFLAKPENAGIESIRLSFIGYVLFAIVNFGLPLLLGYRWSIAELKKKEPNE